MDVTLASLNGQTVAIELSLPGRVAKLRGGCTYEQDEHLGQVLRVSVNDEAGNFEMLLQESTWAGAVEQDAEQMIPLLRLNASMLSPS